MRTLATVAIVLLGCASGAGVRAASGSSLTPAEDSAARRIEAHQIEGHLRFLADDLLEGRAPGSRGSQIALRYLAAQLEAAGLVGGIGQGPSSSFLQAVPLVRHTARPPDLLTVQGGGRKVELRRNKDVVVRSFADSDRVSIKDAELVFVGYGIVAPEHGWDDYKDKDVRGKIAVLLNFNPPFAGERVRLWYGRWNYKYQTAARHGAAGALLIHTTDSAGYPWSVVESSNGPVGFALPPSGEPRPSFQGWITEEAAAKVFALAGRDLASETRAATDPVSKGVTPSPLGLHTSLEMPVLRETIESANVLGLVPGTDEKLKDELVIYTAHHDHLGSVPSAPGGDGIYNGALDNASGCAALLAIARAAAASPPRRSLLFLFVTAEEQGLLGSRWYAGHPTVPPGRIAANINLDSVNRHGRTHDVTMIGHGKSSLDEVVAAVAAAQGRTVHGDAFPDRGFFYRSDQLELARIGVPVVYAAGGPSYVGRPPAWGRERREEYERKNYHQPSDEYPPYPGGWDLSGAVEDARLQLLVGLRIANAPEMPSWKPGDEFERARKEAPR